MAGGKWGESMNVYGWIALATAGLVSAVAAAMVVDKAVNFAGEVGEDVVNTLTSNVNWYRQAAAEDPGYEYFMFTTMTVTSVACLILALTLLLRAPKRT